MNRQVVSVLSVLALVVLAAPTSGVSVQSSNSSNDSSLGSNVSSFMQMSAVEAESELDRGMFSAELANAPNDSARQRLVEHRASRLSERLDTVRQRVETAERDDGVVARSVASARVDALERSVADVDTMAEQVGVTPPGLADLKRNVRGLREPPVPPVIDTEEAAPGVPGSGQGDGESPRPNDDGAPGNSDGEGATGNPDDATPANGPDKNPGGGPDENPGEGSNDDSAEAPDENPGEGSGESPGAGPGGDDDAPAGGEGSNGASTPADPDSGGASVEGNADGPSVQGGANTTATATPG